MNVMNHLPVLRTLTDLCSPRKSAISGNHLEIEDLKVFALLAILRR
jgi:hypothetical protein